MVVLAERVTKVTKKRVMRDDWSFCTFLREQSENNFNLRKVSNSSLSLWKDIEIMTVKYYIFKEL